MPTESPSGAKVSHRSPYGIAIPEDHMKYVMQHVDENTAVAIDTYDMLSGGEDWPDSTWPGK